MTDPTVRLPADAVTADDEATTPAGRTRVAAYALLRDADGRVLLCHIAPSVGVGDVRTLPGGGLEFGESPAAAVQREVEEETGLVTRVGPLLDVSDRLFARGEGDPLHAIRIVYRAEIVDGTMRDEPDGSTDMCRWFAPAETAGLHLGELARRALARLDDAP
jgi:8-oxo-dGTP pyrophosphatase MutT (NUDIX family)